MVAFILQFCAAWVLIHSGSLPSNGASAQGIVDGILAKVNGEPVFLRDLMVERRLGGGQGKTASVETILETVIEKQILLQEAMRLKLGRVDQEAVGREVGKRMASLAGKPGSDDRLPTRREIEAWITAREAVEIMKQKRIGLLIVVGDAEVQDYYRENKGRFGGRGLAAVRGEIERILYAEKFDVYHEDWFEGLKSRSRIERYLSEEPWRSFDFERHLFPH